MKLQVDSITTHTVREYVLRDLDASVHTYQEYMYKEYLDANNQYVGHEIFGLPEWISMEGTQTEQEILEYIDLIDTLKKNKLYLNVTTANATNYLHKQKHRLGGFYPYQKEDAR